MGQLDSMGIHYDSLQYLHFLHPCCPGRRTRLSASPRPIAERDPYLSGSLSLEHKRAGTFFADFVAGCVALSSAAIFNASADILFETFWVFLSPVSTATSLSLEDKLGSHMSHSHIMWCKWWRLQGWLKRFGSAKSVAFWVMSATEVKLFGKWPLGCGLTVLHLG